MTDHRKRGAPSGSVPSSRPRQRSRPSSDREEILQRMKAAAVIVLVLSTVVTSVVVHRLLRPILERNEYYASEKRERELPGRDMPLVTLTLAWCVLNLETHVTSFKMNKLSFKLFGTDFFLVWKKSLDRF